MKVNSINIIFGTSLVYEIPFIFAIIYPIDWNFHVKVTSIVEKNKGEETEIVWICFKRAARLIKGMCVEV